jgi:ABC transporter fused permease/ATP-binding protein
VSRRSVLPLRRLLSLARPERVPLTIGTILLFLASGLELLYPQVIKQLIDGVLASRDISSINSLAMALLMIAVLQSASVTGRVYLFTLCGERIVARLRDRLYRSILSQEIAFFDQRRTGDLTNRLASDTTLLQSAVSSNIATGLRNITTVIGGLTLLFYSSRSLTLLMVVTVPPLALAAVFVGRRLRRHSRDMQESLARASEVAEETFSGIRTVRSFAQEKAEGQRYSKAIWRSFGVAKKRAKNAAAFTGFTFFAGYGSIALVLWYGGRLIVADQMSVGELTSYLLYTATVALSVSSLGDLWADLMRSAGAATHIFELLDREPRLPVSGGEILDKVEGRVEFRSLSFVYPARPDVSVLKKIDLTLNPGEIVALVGPSGSGKSTLSALISRLYDPTDGRILFDGRELTELDPTWVRRQIGVVSQEPILFSTTIEQNIRYGREEASDEDVILAAKAANAHDFIAKFPDGYETQVGERGVQLSGGQKQRIAIARAVLKDPRVLILDEATSALDAESEFLVKEALDRLMQGRTTLVIAHRLSTVKDAHRVVVLFEGTIVQTGNHEELMQEEGIYRRLVQRQFFAARAEAVPEQSVPCAVVADGHGVRSQPL